MNSRINKTITAATLVAAIALSALATNNCVTTASLPCYGAQTSCTFGVGSNPPKGTPGGSSGNWNQCTSGCPGGTKCIPDTDVNPQACSYTCTVNGVPHTVNTTIYPKTGTSGTCPPPGQSC